MSHNAFSAEDLQAATDAIDALLNSGVSGDVLHARAQEALKVLDDDSSAQWNDPPCLRQFASDRKPAPPAFTVKRLFDAMLDAAQEMGLKEGYRFTNAAICVFSDMVDPVEAMHDLYWVHPLARLAMLLVVHLLWPFVACTEVPDLGRTTSNGCTCLRCTIESGIDLQSCYPAASDVEKQIMKRDNYTCAATGALWEGTETWDLRTETSKTAYDLEITHVVPDFRRLFVDKDQSDTATTGFLQRYCELSPQYWTERVEAPGNFFLLDLSTHSAWKRWLWAWVPSETPAHYRLVNYMPYRFAGYPDSEDVVFVDHSKERAPEEGKPEAEAGVPIPDAKFLRARAAITSVLHRSGILFVFESIRWTAEQDEGTELGADGESLLRFLATRAGGSGED